MNNMPDWGRMAVWGIDFCRAMVSRPFIFRIILRWAMGKYAYHEFIGLMDCVTREGFGPYDNKYYLQNMDYHKDPVPFDYGKERKPLPLKR